MVSPLPPLPPFLAAAPAALRDEFRGVAVAVPLDAGRVLLQPGAACGAMLFPIDAAVRIYQTGAEGREVTLYRIDPAESCVLSASCAIGEEPFPAIAAVERAGRAWAVPTPVFRGWVDRHAFWRKYVFSLIARRLGQVLAKMEDVAFRRVDARLAQTLLARAQAGVVRATHQRLADEVGTAREVVSRTLAEWQRAGWIDGGRGSVTLRRQTELERLAGGA
jgi:CRP/FNR family transcriptional regulator